MAKLTRKNQFQFKVIRMGGADDIDPQLLEELISRFNRTILISKIITKLRHKLLKIAKLS